MGGPADPRDRRSPASRSAPRRSPTRRSIPVRGSRSCRSRRTSTTRTRSASGTSERTLQAGYVPREVAPELAGDEQAVSLWRAGGGPARAARRRPGAWVGRPPEVASGSVPYEFKLPDLGEGLTEGEVARWLVAEGDEIAEDAPAGRDPDRQDDGRDPVAGRRPRLAHPRRRGRGRPGRHGARRDRRRRRRRPRADAPATAVSRGRPGTSSRRARAARCRRRRSSAASHRSSASS